LPKESDEYPDHPRHRCCSQGRVGCKDRLGLALSEESDECPDHPRHRCCSQGRVQRPARSCLAEGKRRSRHRCCSSYGRVQRPTRSCLAEGKRRVSREFVFGLPPEIHLRLSMVEIDTRFLSPLASRCVDVGSRCDPRCEGFSLLDEHIPASINPSRIPLLDCWHSEMCRGGW